MSGISLVSVIRDVYCHNTLHTYRIGQNETVQNHPAVNCRSTGDRSLRQLSIPFSLALFCTGILPICAQDDSENRSVIRVEECHITLAAERQLASGQSGIISVVHAREGDRVKKGQLLAELDATVPKATLAIAAKQAENDVNVRFARASARVASAEYRAAVDANKRRSGAFPPIQMQKMQLEEERSILEMEVSKHEFAVNKLRRDEAAALVASYRIVAPMNGLISRVFKSSGEAVQVGESVIQCQSTDKVHVEAHVNIKLLPLVTKGRHVKVIPTTPHPAIDPDAAAFDGTVFFVGVFADLSTDTVRVLVEVDNQHGLLLAGTDAVLEITPISAVAQSAATQSISNRRD